VATSDKAGLFATSRVARFKCSQIGNLAAVLFERSEPQLVA